MTPALLKPSENFKYLEHPYTADGGGNVSEEKIVIEEREPKFPDDFWGEIVGVSPYQGKFGNPSVDVQVRADKPTYRNLQHIFLPYRGIEFDADGKIRLNRLTYTGFFYAKLMELGWRPKKPANDPVEFARNLIGLKGHFKRMVLKEIEPRMRTRSAKWVVVELGEPPE